MPTTIHLSPAAARLGDLAAAICAAGGILAPPGAEAGFRVIVAAGEAGDCSLRIRSAAVSQFTAASPGSCAMLAIAAADIAFAAALIVALSRGNDQAAAADPASIALNRLTARVGDRDVTVMISGPTGTGKEGIARHLHACSPRRAEPFVAVNCAALPEPMLEALLFGHERGAFTGAAGSARGLFRAAEGGTLLLDEVAELPLGLQAKLLRTLQEREVLPIGATVALPIDVRIVVTANRDLAAEVAAGRFRADLFYRLAVFPLTTTPLADRPDDIVPITAALWLRLSGGAWPTPRALAALVAHDWPGNVRELSNVLQRALVLCDGDHIHRHDIVFDAPPAPPSRSASLGGQVREREYAVIRSTLADCAGRRGEAARRLGISERTLRYKLAAMSGRDAGPTRPRTTLQ